MVGGTPPPWPGRRTIDVSNLMPHEIVLSGMRTRQALRQVSAWRDTRLIPGITVLVGQQPHFIRASAAARLRLGATLASDGEASPSHPI
jgi:hypothetical protein